MDIKVDKLNEEVYTKDDVSEIIDFTASAIKTQINAEIGSIINMGTLAIKQLFENSELKGVELGLETATLEDQILLDALEKMSLDAAMPKSTKRAGNLPSFRDEAKAMKEESDRLDENNAKLQLEISNLRAKMVAAEKKLARLNESKHDFEMQSKAEMEELQEKLEESKEENAKRVADTAQFRSMRRIMDSQTAKIKELRMKLAKYEPDSIAAEDDDH
eukprot:gene22194-30434_t